jgi:predicted nuclease with TOPRIM domain
MVLNILIVVLLFFISFGCFYLYLSKYNKKFKEQTKKFDEELALLTTQIDELSNVTESQKNVILSQRSELNTMNVAPRLITEA